MTTSMSAGTTVLLVLLALAAMGVLHIWTSGVKAGRKVEHQVREFTRVSRVASGALVAALVIAGVQWTVVTHSQPSAVWVFVLGLPALLAGVTVGRLLAVTTVVYGGYGRRGVHR
jgi:hypothetical protein